MKSRAIRALDYTISEGDAGIYETVDYMWHYALRDTSEPLVKRLVSSLRGSSALDTIRNIYNWVWRNVEYKLDPADREMITAPIHYVNGNRRTGDCDCMTTLLVCLLESSGFDCAIKVISWRVKDYTHVFAEVWYKGSWRTLDPTLKSGGFGKQDKKIRRYKRITKEDMGRLQVLSDGGIESSSEIEKISDRLRNKLGRLSSHRKCYGNEDCNTNSNNININFGTSVENAHNSTDSRSNSNNWSGGGRSVDIKELPLLDSVYNHSVARRGVDNRVPVVLRSSGRGVYDVVDNNRAIVPVVNPNGIGSLFGRKGVVSSSSSRALFHRGLLRAVRPNYVPLVSRNYYQEFP